jgi:hypothetical protein
MRRAALLILVAAGCSEDAARPLDAALPPAPDLAMPDLAPAAPPSLLLTVNELPVEMNGSQPYTQKADNVPHDFRVRVNRADFTLDAEPPAASGPIDWSTLRVACDQPLTFSDATTLAANTSFGIERFEAGAAPGWKRVHFTGNALPDGVAVRCSAAVDGPGGHAESAVPFLAGTLPPALDPFPKPDTWLVVLSRDIFKLDIVKQPNGTEIINSIYVPTGNGQPDFDEPFYELGLFSRKSPQTTQQVRGMVLALIRAEAYRILNLGSDGSIGTDSVRMKLFFEGDSGAPKAADYAGGAGGFSMIALGGDGTPQDQADKIVGTADIDWNNRVENDDTVYGRGVYPTSIIRQALANSLSLAVLGSILPSIGTPIGESPLDPILLAPDFDPKTSTNDDAVSRYQTFQFALQLVSIALASTLCHEMGHSLGLVPSGPTPRGLFAEMPGLNFTVNDVDGAHIDTPGLNVMQTGKVTNWTEALDSRPRFNELNLAYLRRRLVVGAP